MSSPSRLGSSPSSASSCLIRSCICLFYICALLLGRQAWAAESADALYAQRENLERARQAAGIWAGELRSNQQDFEAAWKLARASYWLGGHAPEQERRGFLDQGIDAGRKAGALMPQRAEGHYWMAANMGALAESFGLRQGLKYRKPIKDALETVRKIDPAFLQGSADRALGRWYFKVPRLFGGSHKQAEEHLRASLAYNPHSTATHFFLAELLVDDGRTDEAREELRAVLAAPVDPEWEPENRDFKSKAEALLQRLGPAKGRP